jgi:hypothetical protein
MLAIRVRDTQQQFVLVDVDVGDVIVGVLIHILELSEKGLQKYQIFQAFLPVCPTSLKHRRENNIFKISENAS